MICILSQDLMEQTTETVIDWLRSWKIPFIRINAEDMKVGSLSIRMNNQGATVSCQAGKLTLDPDRIKVVWLRRWRYHNERESELLLAEMAYADWQKNATTLTVHLRQELRTVSEFIFDCLSSARWLTDPNTSTVNKLAVLKSAAECGIDIPDSIVSTDRSSLSGFAAKHERVITKSIGNALVCDFDGRSFATYTSLIQREALDRSGRERVFPTLIQEYLEKEYEIRAVYLDGRFYTMAIFSQSDEQTSVDFRRYLFTRPNRTVPYELPDALSSKLSTLMQKLGLETGSLDLVKTVDGRFVFLEVNPVGQFGMVSYPCNYFLEREVASALVRRLNDS